MTISILAFDGKSGVYGGAAATGSLCVGGWVLRGDAESGLSASQGSLPSTFWGIRALEMMKTGTPAAEAVTALTGGDAGRAHRQMTALDLRGGTGTFTGTESIPAAGSRQAHHAVVAGNMLASEAVLDACLGSYLDAAGEMSLRLLAALDAAQAAGGDKRGFQSAALLVVARDRAPLTLRIDYSDKPLQDLHALHRRATTGDYAEWAMLVPTLEEPERGNPYEDKPPTPAKAVTPR